MSEHDTTISPGLQAKILAKVYRYILSLPDLRENNTTPTAGNLGRETVVGGEAAASEPDATQFYQSRTGLHANNSKTPGGNGS